MKRGQVTVRAASAGSGVGWHVLPGLWLWRHGAWLPVAGLLFAAAAGLAWQTRQLEQQIADLRSVTPAAPNPSEAPAGVADADRLAAIVGVLPPAAEATPQVRRLVELTRPQFAWQRAEFQQSEEAAVGAIRLQITVPVVGEYAGMRAALERSLEAMPNLSLEQVQLRRAQPDATRLEARLRFSLWMTSKP